MSEKTNNGTPYDDVFRTLFTDSDMLAISLINEMFGENIALDTELRRFPNEHFLDGNQKRISDSNSTGSSSDGPMYHMECESVAGDSAILVRLFEYKSGIALEHARLEGNTLYVEFPLTGILYLRSTRSTPDSMKMVISSPDSDSMIETEVKVMKLSDYTLDEILEKKLYFLIPFYMFNFEKDVIRVYRKTETPDDADSEAIQVLKNWFLENINNVICEIEHLAQSQEINSYVYALIRQMFKKVTENLYGKYNGLWRGVENIMGGKVLDYEAKDILNEGKRLGREQRDREIIRDMLLNGRSSADIAEFCGYDKNLVDEINDELFEELS